MEDAEATAAEAAAEAQAAQAQAATPGQATEAETASAAQPQAAGPARGARRGNVSRRTCRAARPAGDSGHPPGPRGAGPGRHRGRRGQPDLAGDPGSDGLERLSQSRRPAGGRPERMARGGVWGVVPPRPAQSAQRRAEVLEQVVAGLDARPTAAPGRRAPPAPTRPPTRASSGPGARSATPPRRATRPSVNSRVRPQISHRLGLPAAGDRNDTMPPNPRICLRGHLVAGMRLQPGIEHLGHRGCAASMSATRCAFWPCRSIRTARVFTPRSVSHASNGPPAAPVAFWMKTDLLSEAAVGHHERAADHVGVPAYVLRGGVHDHVRAEHQRLLQVGRGERVVHHEQRALVVRELRERADVGDREQRVRRRLHPHDRGGARPAPRDRVAGRTPAPAGS